MGQKLEPITGTPIDLLNLPKGCPFAPRCDAAMKICIKEAPDSMDINEDHKASCWVNVKAVQEGNISDFAVNTDAVETTQEGDEVDG
jgi:oligopeptide transport system ATP-binding protein